MANRVVNDVQHEKVRKYNLCLMRAEFHVPLFMRQDGDCGKIWANSEFADEVPPPESSTSTTNKPEAPCDQDSTLAAEDYPNVTVASGLLQVSTYIH